MDISYPAIVSAGSYICRLFHLLKKRMGSREDGIGCNGTPLQAIPRAHHCAERLGRTKMQQGSYLHISCVSLTGSESFERRLDRRVAARCKGFHRAEVNRA